MKVFYRLPRRIEGCVLTIGTFDGLHRGHQRVICELRQQAKILHLPGVVLTFTLPPRQILTKTETSLLLTKEEKLDLLCRLGVDTVVLLSFNQKLARLSPEEFFKEIIVEHLRAKSVVVGYNFAFGWQRQGEARLLKKLGKKYNLAIKIIPPVKQQGIIVSSSRIRQLLQKNAVEKVNTFLGYPYNFQGQVVKGRQRGRQIAIPTANLILPRGKIIPSGVFAVYVREGKKIYSGVANIGFRPTFGALKNPLAEVHIFNFSGSLYGKKLKIFLLKKMRAEKKFASADKLKKQIKTDIAQAQAYFDIGDGVN